MERFMNLIFTAFGCYGALAVLAAHFLVSREVAVPRLWCHCLNASGAIGLVCCAFAAHDYPLALLNIAWTGVALYSVFFPKTAKDKTPERKFPATEPTRLPVS
jgi:hypothetical protein